MSAANRNKKRVAKGFEVTDAMIDDFRASLRQQRIPIDEDAFAKDLAFIRAMIHYDIDLALFGVAEARRNLIEVDPQAQFGMQQFNEAVRIAQMARARPARGGGGREHQ
jgi:hypothetical protein